MNPPNDESGVRIDHWLAALADPDWNTRATAAHMLGELGERAPLEPLLAAFHDEDESVRAAAVRAAGKRGKHAPLDHLIGMLSDPSWMVREMAALTLGELGERAPAGPLLDMLHAEQEDAVVREAAQIALQQAHPDLLLLPAQCALSINPAQSASPGAADHHDPIQSSPAWFISPAHGFSRRHPAIELVGNHVEQADRHPTTNASPPLPAPVIVNSRHFLPRRIAVGVLIVFLLLSSGLSWLWFTHKPLQSSQAGATPTAHPTFTPTGTGSSVSLTVADGVVYVGVRDSTLRALRASDGSLLWQFKTAGPVGGPEGSAVVVDGMVYVSANVDQGRGAVTGYLYALRASDGALLWQYTTQNYVYSPTVADGVVYVNALATSLTALRASDGALLWHYTAKGFVIDPLTVNGIVYVLVTNTVDHSPDYLGALRASDGTLLWSTPSGAWAPMVVNGVVYTTSEAGLSALRARDGALLWRYAPADIIFSGPMVVDGVVYTVASKYLPDATPSPSPGGYARQITAPSSRSIPFKEAGPSSLYALQASDGTLLWHYPASGDQNTEIGLLAVIGGLVYIYTVLGLDKGLLSALHASDGSLLWTQPSDATIYLPLVVGPGVLYVTASAGVVSALQVRDGKERWHYTLGGNIYSAPMLEGSTLFLGGANGVVYALDASTGSLRWQYATYLGS